MEKIAVGNNIKKILLLLIFLFNLRKNHKTFDTTFICFVFIGQYFFLK